MFVCVCVCKRVCVFVCVNVCLCVLCGLEPHESFFQSGAQWFGGYFTDGRLLFRVKSFNSVLLRKEDWLCCEGG